LCEITTKYATTFCVFAQNQERLFGKGRIRFVSSFSKNVVKILDCAWRSADNCLREMKRTAHGAAAYMNDMSVLRAPPAVRQGRHGAAPAVTRRARAGN